MKSKVGSVAAVACTFGLVYSTVAQCIKIQESIPCRAAYTEDFDTCPQNVDKVIYSAGSPSIANCRAGMAYNQYPACRAGVTINCTFTWVEVYCDETEPDDGNGLTSATPSYGDGICGT